MTMIQRDQHPSIGEAAFAAYSAIPFVRFGQPGHDEYMSTQAALDAEFKTLLHQEHAIGFPDALHERIYELAYASGHASGFESIEQEYDDLARFAREVLTHFDIDDIP